MPRRHFSFSLSPSLCCQPGETLRRATSATEKNESARASMKLAPQKIWKIDFYTKATQKWKNTFLLYLLCWCWQSTNVLLNLHYNQYFCLVKTTRLNIFNIYKVGKCADRLFNIWFSTKKVIHDLMLCLELLYSKCWTCTIVVTLYFKVPWTVQSQFHCATVLFCGVIFTLLLTQNI